MCSSDLGREEILKVHAKKVALAPGIDFNTVARMASGASGAELANIVNEAALRAVRAGRKSVTEADLEESIEVVIAGYQKKNSILTDKEKCMTVCFRSLRLRNQELRICLVVFSLGKDTAQQCRERQVFFCTRLCSAKA